MLGAEKGALKEVAGVGDGVVHTLKLVEALGVRTLREAVIGRPVIGTWQAVLDYCTARLGKQKTEHFRVLFLDSHNALIADEEQQQGTVDHVVLYPREVIKRALEHGASAVVLVHNHPSGNPSPSRADIELTKEVAKAGAHARRDRPRSSGDRPLPSRLLQGGGPAARLRATRNRRQELFPGVIHERTGARRSGWFAPE